MKKEDLSSDYMNIILDFTNFYSIKYFTVIYSSKEESIGISGK